jgi:hypothetical protein
LECVRSTEHLRSSEDVEGLRKAENLWWTGNSRTNDDFTISNTLSILAVVFQCTKTVRYGELKPCEIENKSDEISKELGNSSKSLHSFFNAPL